MGFYRKYYNQKELWGHESDQEERLAKLTFIKMIPQDVDTVLDVGCGDGSLTNLMVEIGKYDVTGCDISDEALKYVKTKTVKGNIEKLPFEEESFDLVICSDVLEHLPNEVLKKGIYELQRVSKKYIMIMGPHNENLNLSKTRCCNCGTVFHINHHIHSFTKNDYLHMFRDTQMVYYAYTGGKWPSVNKYLLKVKQEIAGDWAFWDKAICPLCGEKQYQRDLHIKEHLISNACDKLNSYYTDILSLLSPAEKEIIILFQKQQSSQLNGTKDKTSLLIRSVKNQPLNKILNKIIINQKSRYQINPGQKLYTQELTDNFKEHPYILVNERMDWGQEHQLDGRLVRDYRDNSGLDCHAIFICPPMLVHQGISSLEVSYKDVSDEPVYIEVFDQRQLKYLRLGSLDNLNDGKWKKSIFDVPLTVNPSPEGLIFHFITDKQHPQDNHPIAEIIFHHGADVEKEKTTELPAGKEKHLIASLSLDELDLTTMLSLETVLIENPTDDVLIVLSHDQEIYFLDRIFSGSDIRQHNLILPLWLQANETDCRLFTYIEKQNLKQEMIKKLVRIKLLEEKYDLIKKEKDELEQELFIIHEAKKSLQEELSNLRKENSAVHREIAVLKDQNQKYSSIIKELEDKLAERNTSIEDMAKDMEVMKTYKKKYKELIDLPAVSSLLRLLKERKRGK